jgi:hypothetical protein
LAETPNMTQTVLLRKWWSWLAADPSNLALVRLGLEAAALDATNTGLPYEIRARQIGVWRTEIEERLVEEGIPRAVAALEASIVKATFTGLVIDLMATAESNRLTDALDVYLQNLENRLRQLTQLV